MFYRISGTAVEITTTGYRITHQVPTFYLNGNIQGIVDENHAVKIAKTIVNPADTLLEVHLTAVKA